MPATQPAGDVGVDDYQSLLESIRAGLSTQAPVSRCTRSHVALASPSPSASSSSDDESDDELSPSSRSGGDPGTSRRVKQDASSGAKPAARARRSAAVEKAGPRKGDTADVEESDAGPGGDDAAAWRFGEWQPDMAMPAPATVASAARQESELAASMLPGSAQLQRAVVRDVRREARAAARDKDASAGRGWFDMKAQTITPEVKRDWRLLRLRSAYDPRHFYKGFDSTKIPKHFEMGTVIEGTGEFYSGRLTKRERKQTFTEEILADVKVKRERKRRYDKMQAEREELARKRKKARGHHKRSAHRPKH